jgi:hypothetical protein
MRRCVFQQQITASHAPLLFLPSNFLLLKCPRRNRQHDDQTRDNQPAGHRRHNQDAASRRRELASDNVVLALEEAVEADEEDEDGDGDEGGAERLANLTEAGLRRADERRVRGRDGRVQPEELRYRDADAGEGERGAEPGQEGAFCGWVESQRVFLLPN